MFVIGKGTDPALMNEDTVAFDKGVLESLEKNEPAGGYPPEQAKAIQELRDRIDSYESQNGVVDVQSVHSRHDANNAAKMAMIGNLAKSLGHK